MTWDQHDLLLKKLAILETCVQGTVSYVELYEQDGNSAIGLFHFFFEFRDLFDKVVEVELCEESVV